MALNFNIPMPDVAGSFQKGFGLTDNLMNQILGRNQLKQKTEHDEATLKQLESHFQQNFGLSKAAAGRAAVAAADAHKLALQKQDPLFEAKQYAALEDYWRSRGNPGMQQGAVPGEQQASQPTQEMGEGMGMFSPQGMQEAQQQQNPSNPMGIDLELMKQHPMLRGWYKKHYGVDPLAAVAQTPQDKQAMAIDLFKQKEELKKQNKGGDVPTNTVLTQNQQALQGINTVLPMLDELINNPKSVYGPTDFSPSKKAAYNAKTSGMIDTLVAAQSLPKVQASIDLVEQQIRRGTNESTGAYIARLKDLRKDLVNRKGRAKDVLSNRKVNTNDDDFSQMSDDELRKIAGGGQ